MSYRTYREKKDEIIRLFQNYQTERAYTRLQELLRQNPEDYELHYLSGMIQGSVHNYVVALQGFKQALERNPEHAPSHFETGIIHTTLCRYNQALKAFQQARRIDPSNSALDYYFTNIQKHKRKRDVTLSACLIVKNEEKLLAQCLRSILAVADEIILVDTGSEDNTLEIAQNFGARIFHYQWQRDFAAARNFANKHATGDWILQIDADEELVPEDQFKVREIVHQGKCNGAYVSLRNPTTSLFGENQPTVHFLVRLYQNRPDIYYENPVHETLRISGEVKASDIRFLHHGYNLDPAYLEEKRKRNAQILYQKWKADPENITILFYLSMLHLANREFDESRWFGQKVLDKLSPEQIEKQHLYLMTLNNLAFIEIEKQNYHEAVGFCERALAINDNYLDPHFFLGLAYFRNGKYAEAKPVFLEFLQRHRKLSERPVFNLFSQSADTYQYQAYHLLGKIYRKEGDLRSAQAMMLKAVQLNRNFWIGYADLGYMQMDMGAWNKAARYLETAIKKASATRDIKKSDSPLWFDYVNLMKNYTNVLKRCAIEKTSASAALS